MHASSAYVRSRDSPNEVTNVSARLNATRASGELQVLRSALDGFGRCSARRSSTRHGAERACDGPELPHRRSRACRLHALELPAQLKPWALGNLGARQAARRAVVREEQWRRRQAAERVCRVAVGDVDARGRRATRARSWRWWTCRSSRHVGSPQPHESPAEGKDAPGQVRTCCGGSPPAEAPSATCPPLGVVRCSGGILEGDDGSPGGVFRSPGPVTGWHFWPFGTRFDRHFSRRCRRLKPRNARKGDRTSAQRLGAGWERWERQARHAGDGHEKRQGGRVDGTPRSPTGGRTAASEPSASVAFRAGAVARPMASSMTSSTSPSGASRRSRAIARRAFRTRSAPAAPPARGAAWTNRSSSTQWKQARLGDERAGGVVLRLQLGACAEEEQALVVPRGDGRRRAEAPHHVGGLRADGLLLGSLRHDHRHRWTGAKTSCTLAGSPCGSDRHALAKSSRSPSPA